MTHGTAPAAIDLEPQAASRPGLALVLALLAIPGSTIAWAAPLGGFWIGLPLALAAVVLGVRARADGEGAGRATAAIVIAGLCIAMMAVWSIVEATDASGQATTPPTLTFLELEKGTTFTHVRNTDGAPERSNLQGDVIASVAPLADEGGTRIGKLHLTCVTTVSARNFMRSEMACDAIAVLPEGTLTAQFVNRVDPTTVGVVTGGTGAYAGASGTIASQLTEGGARNTVTLIP